MSATETKGLAPFMRELRKVIPEAVKIDNKNPTYLVGGRLTLELNYYCRWQEKEEEKVRTCFPANVSIKVNEDAMAKLIYGPNRGLGVSGSKVYSTRTIQVNEEKPLEESLKRISVAVNKALRACDNWIATKKQSDADETAWQKTRKETATELYKALGSPKSMKPNHGGVQSIHYSLGGKLYFKLEMMPKYYGDGKKLYYNMDMNNISPELLDKIVPALKEILNHAKAAESRSDEDG
jgi:hypothetical protein